MIEIELKGHVKYLPKCLTMPGAFLLDKLRIIELLREYKDVDAITDITVDLVERKLYSELLLYASIGIRYLKHHFGFLESIPESVIRKRFDDIVNEAAKTFNEERNDNDQSNNRDGS